MLKSIATMFRPDRLAQQFDSFARGRARPRPAVQTPGATDGSNTSMSPAQINRPAAATVSPTLGNGLREASAYAGPSMVTTGSPASRVFQHAGAIGEAAHPPMCQDDEASTQAFLRRIGELRGRVVAIVRRIGVGVGVAVDMQRDQILVTGAPRPRISGGSETEPVAADPDRYRAESRRMRAAAASILHEGVVDAARHQRDVSRHRPAPSSDNTSTSASEG